MDLESVFQKLGYGRFQQLLIAVNVLISFFPSGWHMISIIWIGARMPHHCTIPASAAVKDWIPIDSDGKLESCLMYSNTSNKNHTIACTDGWTYDYSETGPTIVSKFDLVCNRRSLLELSQTSLSFGVIIGAGVFSVFSDIYGRKPVLILSLLLLSAFGALTVVVPMIELFLFLRFLVGIVQQGIFLNGVLLACEMFDSKKRTYTAIANVILWGIGTSMLPLLAYICQDWVYFQLATSLYGFLCIPMFFWLPETLPWLLANNKEDKAEELVKRIAKTNKIEMPEKVFTGRRIDEVIDVFYVITTDSDGDMKKGVENKGFECNGFEKNHAKLKKLYEETVEKEKKVSFWERLRIFICQSNSVTFKEDVKKTSSTQISTKVLFTSPFLLKSFIVCSLQGFFINLAFYSMTLSSTSLFGNRYLNGFLDAIILVPGGFSAILLLKYFGRKKALFVPLMLAFLTFFIRLILPLTLGQTELTKNFDTALGMIGKFGISSSNSVFQLFMAEQFPTNLRSQAVGICSAINKLGSLIASYATLMVEHYITLFHGLLSSFVLLAAFLTFFLPETDKIPLPETMADIEKLHNKKKKEVPKNINT